MKAEKLPADAPCLDAVSSISARTLDCTGKADSANARYELFFQRFACIEVDVTRQPVADYFHCSLAIGSLTCDQVQAFGDDLDRWFSTSAACAYIIRHTDGTPMLAPVDRDAGAP